MERYPSVSIPLPRQPRPPCIFQALPLWIWPVHTLLDWDKLLGQEMGWRTGACLRVDPPPHASACEPVYMYYIGKLRAHNLGLPAKKIDWERVHSPEYPLPIHAQVALLIMPPAAYTVGSIGEEGLRCANICQQTLPPHRQQIEWRLSQSKPASSRRTVNCSLFPPSVSDVFAAPLFKSVRGLNWMLDWWAESRQLTWATCFSLLLDPCQRQPTFFLTLSHVCN